MGPLFEGRIASPINELVNARASWFEISRLFIFPLIAVVHSFSNVVVFLQTLDFAPKTEVSSTGGRG